MRKHNEDKLGMSYRMRKEEFEQQFGAKTIWVVPSKDNIQTMEDIWNWHISQLQSVFEEIEEISGDRDLVADFRDLPAFHKVGANLDKMRLLAAVSNSKYKRFVKILGSIRQKWLGKEEEK